MKKFTFLRERLGLILLIISCLFLVVLKLPHLSLPYYWDEAFPYSFAVNYMYENGLSLLPNALPPVYSTGHPMLFYFLEAAWMKVFGNGLVSAHTFPLVISLLLLLATYQFGSAFFTPLTGGLASLILAVQNVFLAQSTFVLPETLFALLALYSIHCYLKKNWILYLTMCSLLLLTRETGILVPAVLAGIQLYQLIFKKSMNTPFLNVIFAALPLATFLAFFTLQHHIHGWFFFPRHTGFMSFSPTDISMKLESYFSYLFIYYGRNFISITLLLCLVITLVRKKFNHEQREPVVVLIFFIVTYLLFSALNFYSNRYILCLFAPFTLLTSQLLIRTLKDFHKSILIGLSCLVVSIPLHSALTKRSDSDHTLGYVDAVKVHQLTINYLMDHDFQHDKIFTHYLMIHNLSNHQPGYIPKNKLLFTNVHSNPYADTDLFVFSSTEYSAEYEEYKINYSLTLLKRFSINNAWVEIYKSQYH